MHVNKITSTCTDASHKVVFSFPVGESVANHAIETNL